MNDFHFSPRPNRAHEIAWRSWSEQTLAEAKAADKPILFSLSAVWCHWCHVMDETSYSDPDVIAAINESFIPVRVDADQAPWAIASVGEGAVVARRPDGAVEVELAVTNRGALRSWVLGFLDHAEVLAPPAERAELCRWLADLAGVEP